jgi:uncharacterized membrane protein
MPHVQDAIGLLPFNHAMFYEHFYHFCHGHFVDVAGLQPHFYNAFTSFHVLLQVLLWHPLYDPVEPRTIKSSLDIEMLCIRLHWLLVFTFRKAIILLRAAFRVIVKGCYCLGWLTLRYALLGDH